MAGKSKAPEYQAQEPAFLRKLRQANTGGYAEDGRQLNPVSIARAKRLEKNESDDAPTYVGEEGQTLTSDEAAKVLAGEIHGAKESGGGSATALEGQKTATATIGDSAASRKRKAVKVIGETEADDAETVGKAKSAKVSPSVVMNGQKTVSKNSTGTGAPKKKRKTPAVALSFGDDDAD